MARTARKKSSTGIYHILLRSNNTLFLNEEDKKYFKELLQKYFTDSLSACIYGYSLTKKKIHLIINEKNEDVSTLIKPFCTSYARYFNRVHSVTGKLFADRFKSEPVESNIALSQLILYLYKGDLAQFKADRIIAHSDLKKLNISSVKKVLPMDDYENMTYDELKSAIGYITGDIKGFSKLTVAEKIALIQEIDVDKRLRIGLISKGLGIEKAPTPAPKKATKKKVEAKKEKALVVEKKQVEKQAPVKKEKAAPVKKQEIQKKVDKPVAFAEDAPKPQPPKKKELSVWLL